MASGAGQLEDHDVQLRRIDERPVELSASWSMNVGRGVITCERWVKQRDGAWRLVYDAFEIEPRSLPPPGSDDRLALRTSDSRCSYSLDGARIESSDPLTRYDGQSCPIRVRFLPCFEAIFVRGGRCHSSSFR